MQATAINHAGAFFRFAPVFGTAGSSGALLSAGDCGRRSRLVEGVVSAIVIDHFSEDQLGVISRKRAFAHPTSLC